MGRETKLPMSKQELYYYDETDKIFKPLVTEGAIPVTVINGGTGGSSMSFLTGGGAPTLEAGKDGDVYLNSDNGDLHRRTDGQWFFIMNIKGEQGIQGEKGETGNTGGAGKDGADGFGTEAQYNDIIARLQALENPEA